MIFGGLEFFGKLQRRGAHVSILKIGSRDGIKCFWGNVGIYADLRRELGWGWPVWAGLEGASTWGVEEGGTMGFLEECWRC
jgi:hypothetical protein